MTSVVQTARYAVGRDDSGASIAKARLNPAFRYLRVTIKGRVALLALGYVDRHPEGPIEVWYSAEREVLRLQNGRVVGAVGLTTEWRNVSVPELPSWATLAGAKEALHWRRIRDVMPGYRYGVTDSLSLRVVSAPERSALQELDPRRLTWFEERLEPSAGATSVSPVELGLPPARYALDFGGAKETVVYGELCLAPEVCFTWQRWPVDQPGPGAKG